MIRYQKLRGWLSLLGPQRLKLPTSGMLAYSFSSLYKQIRNQSFYQVQYKALGLSFSNQGTRMQVYSLTPLVGQAATVSEGHARIIFSRGIISLTFVAEVESEMSEDAWQNRKSIMLDLAQARRLFKLDSQHPNISFSLQYQTSEGRIQDHIEIDYKPGEQEVSLFLQRFNVQTESKLPTWDVNFLLSYNEYLTLLQWIRSGLYYTSGAATMIEHSKFQALEAAANKENQIKRTRQTKIKKGGSSSISQV